jgi:hypothetical protein
MPIALVLPTARSKGHLRDAGAERMCLHGKWWGRIQFHAFIVTLE